MTISVLIVHVIKAVDALLVTFQWDLWISPELFLDLLTLGRKRGRWMPLPRNVFLSVFLKDKTSAPDVFSSCSFIPRADFEMSLVMVSCYGYEVWCHK